MNSRNKEPCQLDGWSEDSSKSSEIFQIMDELLAKDSFEDLVVEGKSCEEMLKELENVREVITQDLLVKTMVSTDSILERE